MSLGTVRVVPFEHRVAAIAAGHQIEDVLTAMVVGRHGRDRGAHAEQLEFRKRRPLGLFVDDHAHVLRVIDRKQADLVDVGGLAQFLGHSNVEESVPLGELVAPDRDVLVMIHGKVHAPSEASAQRRHSQHFADVLEPRAVPREYHGAGPREPRRFLDRDLACLFLRHFVLNQAVGPCDANGVEGLGAAKPEVQRHAGIDLLGIGQPRLDLDARLAADGRALDSLEPDRQAAIARFSAVGCEKELPGKVGNQ